MGIIYLFNYGSVSTCGSSILYICLVGPAGDGRSLRPALSSWSASSISLWVPGGYSRGVGIFPFPSLRCAIRLGPPLCQLG